MQEREEAPLRVPNEVFSCNKKIAEARLKKKFSRNKMKIRGKN